MGGASGEAFSSTLVSTGMDPAHVLAREAIQNSVDAGQEIAEKVKVRFRSVTLTGASKAEFVAAAALHTIASRAKRLRLQEPNCLADLHDAKKPLHLLFVEDFNTTGLIGDPHDSKSKFYRFYLGKS